MEAAKRQLETAIELWFRDADAVSIHTLTGAGRQILVDLNKHHGGDPMGGDCMEATVEGRKLARKAVARAENFLKHAEKDPATLLEFNTEETVFMLWEAVDKFEELFGPLPPTMMAFMLHRALTRADLSNIHYLQGVINSPPIEALAKLNKHQFFTEITSLLRGKP